MPAAAGAASCQRPRAWPRRPRLRPTPTQPCAARSGRRTFIVRFSSAAWILTSSAEPMAPPAAAPGQARAVCQHSARAESRCSAAPHAERHRRAAARTGVAGERRRGRTRRLVHHDARVGHAEALALLAGRLQRGPALSGPSVLHGPRMAVPPRTESIACAVPAGGGRGAHQQQRGGAGAQPDGYGAHIGLHGFDGVQDGVDRVRLPACRRRQQAPVCPDARHPAGAGAGSGPQRGGFARRAVDAAHLAS
jgi:hypothetical protein